jgi:cellobiose-specific phosphotransferase system component IIC
MCILLFYFSFFVWLKNEFKFNMFGELLTSATAFASTIVALIVIIIFWFLGWHGTNALIAMFSFAYIAYATAANAWSTAGVPKY